MFSIAATLLVLDIAVNPPASPLQQMPHAWPAYVAYVVSFLAIGGGWRAHTALTERLTRSDPIFLRLNLLLLLVVAFLPFPTRLAADALHEVDAERVAVTLYGLTLLAIRLLGAALDAYARREHFYSPRGEGEELQATERKLLPIVIGYVSAIGIGCPGGPADRAHSGHDHGADACKVRPDCRLSSLTWLSVLWLIGRRPALSGSVVVSLGGQLHVGGGKLTI